MADERDERRYKAEMRRLKILERRIKLYLATTFIILPFGYTFAVAIAEGFGVHLARLEWKVLVPFMMAGLGFIFNISLKESLILFGGMGSTIGRIIIAASKAASEAAAKPGGEEEGIEEAEAP